MPSNKAIAATGAAVASVAVIGAILALRKNAGKEAGEDDDDAFSAPVSKVHTTPAASHTTEKKSDSTPAAAVKEVPAAKPSVAVAPKAPVAPAMPDAAEDLLEEALAEVQPKAVSEPAKKSVTKASANFSERTEIKNLGLAVSYPSGWEVREELSPVPNVAMVTVWNPDFANMPNAEAPGAVPVIILSVEDIRGENLSLTEFKDRSKDLSLQQMLMMTGGAIQPMVRKDSGVEEGPFRHMLEYAQSMPPFFEISVINLLEVREGVAYVFQIMCNPKVMTEFRPIFMNIAKNMEITSMGGTALGNIVVKTGKVEVAIDTVWSWSYPAADDATQPHLARFELASSVKREEIKLYETDKVPATDSQLRNEKVVNGVTIRSLFDGKQEQKTFTLGDYCLVVQPLQKAISYIPEANLIASIKSVKASTEPPKAKDGATFVTKEHGYSFDMVGRSRVVATKIGNGTAVYAPLGLPQELKKEISPEEQGPTVTVRIGSPENDPDCMATLDEWQTRIEAEMAEGGVSNVKRITLKEQDCLSFSSTEMQETGPGQKVEVRANVYIFVRNETTTLIRWETVTGQWRRYERDMDAFMESFTFLSQEE